MHQTNILLHHFPPSSSSPGTFLEHCAELKSQCVLLGAVQSLLNIPPTPYPELDQTEQDISFLRALYGNYQQFIGFDRKCVMCVCWGGGGGGGGGGDVCGASALIGSV